MRLDFLMIAIGFLLIVAMILTLLFGKEFSRHGYGAGPNSQGQSQASNVLT
jgi:hypothetical protein